ncbi:hypothetical protein F4804DRAFT_352729 [Jackrogersella minutella]|nr:hypothetical protein F4804DRAFT_352729 [Jackrogersella minutella]
MSPIISTVTRAGRQRGSQLIVAASRRSTSWIAWEQPNPALYARPQQTTPSNETQKAASNDPGTRNVGETTVAPSTASVGAGSQEVSTSGKTVPSSIQAGSSRVPFSQTRSVHSKTTSSDLSHLPTTILRIDGMTASWPGESPEHPDQQRVRKQRIVHDQAVQVQSEEASEANHKSGNRIFRVLSSITSTIEAFKENPYTARPVLPFDRAIDKYMNNVKLNAQELEAHEASKDLELFRQYMEEERQKQQRVFDESIAEVSPLSLDKDDVKGKGRA